MKFLKAHKEVTFLSAFRFNGRRGGIEEGLEHEGSGGRV